MTDRGPHDIAALHAKARQRWPLVEWPMDAYREHLGCEACRFAIDLYLGGAAGHRLDSAWAAVEADLGEEVRRVLGRSPSADMTADDLWSETLVRMLADDADKPALDNGRQPARIVRYRGLVKLANYLITVGRRIAIQRNRRPASRAVSLAVAGDANQFAAEGDSPVTSASDAEAVERLKRALADAFASLSGERQFLLSMIYRRQMQQKAVASMLGWSEAKASRQLRAAIEAMGQAVRDAGVEWTPALAAAWGGMWDQCWVSVQETPACASEMANKGGSDHA